MDEGWILCSERLPTIEDGRVLVTMPDKFPYNEKSHLLGCEQTTRVCLALHDGRWFYGDMMAVSRDEPIAWRPLPMPYDGNM